MLVLVLAAAAAQHPCPAGQTLLTTGATATATCVACPPNTYSAAGNIGECIEQTGCPRGTYYDPPVGRDAAATCTACGTGTFMRHGGLAAGTGLGQHMITTCFDYTTCGGRTPPTRSQMRVVAVLCRSKLCRQ